MRSTWIILGAILLARIGFFAYTNYSFDDTFITARYGRNLADGLGFVFNEGERTYGFTSPIWVALSAIGHLLRTDAHTWLATWAIGFNVATAAIALPHMNSLRAKITFAALWIAFPVLNTSTVGAMEVSLLGFTMVAWWFKAMPGWMAALAPLVRPEGWLLVGAHMLRDSFNKLKSGSMPRFPYYLGPGLAWFWFAWAYFGSPIPLSAMAKLHISPDRYPIDVWLSHIVYIPFITNPAIIGVAIAGISGLLLLMALTHKNIGVWLALTIMGFYLITKANIFEWYMYVPYTLIIIAACMSSLLTKWKPASVGLIIYSCFLLIFGVVDAKNNMIWLNRTIYAAGRDANEFSDVRSIIAEPIGYLGYQFKGDVYDEIGLTLPRMLKYRAEGDGWFHKALTYYEPDAILSRPRLLVENKGLSGKARPFENDAQLDELAQKYTIMHAYVDETADKAWVNREVWLLIKNSCLPDSLESKKIVVGRQILGG